MPAAPNAPGRRRPDAPADLPAFPLDPADPPGTLGKALELWRTARMFVAAFEMDFPRMVDLAVAAMPEGLRSGPLAELSRSPDLPRGRQAILYGLITGMEGAGEKARLRLVLPMRLPTDFQLLVESGSQRKDDPVASYWIPVAAVKRGSVTVVDIDTVKLDHPLVVFRIADGVLTIAR